MKDRLQLWGDNIAQRGILTGVSGLYEKKYKKNTKQVKKSLQSGKTWIILTIAVT
jgi:hypothetical protein